MRSHSEGLGSFQKKEKQLSTALTLWRPGMRSHSGGLGSFQKKEKQLSTAPAASCLLPAALLPAVCCLLPAACCLLPAARRPLPGSGGEGAESHKMTPFCDTAFLDGIREIYNVDKLQL